MVHALAWKIHRKLPPQMDVEDLISYGQLGLALAAREFDSGRGTAFTTYAYYRIRGSIFDGLSQMSWFSRADYHASRYESMRDEESPDLPEEAPPRRSRRMKGGQDFEKATDPMADRQASPPDAQAIKAELSACLRQLIDALPPDAATIIRSAYFDGQALHEIGRKLGISMGWTSRLHAQTLEKLGRSLRQSQVV